MSDLISRAELLHKTANREAEALDQVCKLDSTEDRDKWLWWSAVLTERGAFKHDIEKAQAVEPDIVRCKDCANADHAGCIENTVYCLETGVYWHFDDYCSKAEKCEEETK